MYNQLQKLSIAILTLIMLTSCAEELDFSQFNDVEATPTYEASILYLEAPENIINLVNVADDVFSQNFNFDAFSANIFAERVIEGTITYVIENTTSKELEIDIEFLDDDGNVTDTEIFTILPAPTAIIEREIAYGPSGQSIDIITTLSTIRVTARNLGDNTSQSDLSDPMITVKSSGKFRVRLK